MFSWPAIHGGLLVASLIALGCLPALTWPWFPLLPLGGYFCLALALPPLRRTMPAILPGRMDKVGTAVAVVLTAICVGVLLSYQAIAQPDVSYLIDKMPASFFHYVILGGLCFSLGNAVLEELICRWVLYEALLAEWGVVSALLVTSAFFGLSHVNGYPPGPWGALLAGAYGLGLGWLRWWSGGLALAAACHVCADATIFWIMCKK